MQNSSHSSSFLRFLAALTLGLWLANGLILRVAAQSDAGATEVAGLGGGLVVQLGAGDATLAAALSKGGHYVVEVLDVDSGKVDAVRKALRASARYGLVSAQVLTANKRLPYSENLVNAVIVAELEVPIAEVLRVLTPGGVVIGNQATLKRAQLEAAGFGEIVARDDDGSILARKPWPDDMDSWTHPRHGADGNAVSADTAVGPPDRVRWVAAATSEVEGLVSAGGRNFYGGILARDSFNGLRLWHRDLGRRENETNASEFNLPRLSHDRARPIAAEKYLFAVVGGAMVALDAVTGELVRDFPEVSNPREILNEGDTVIATHESGVAAFSVETGQQLWNFAASGARNVAADDRRVSLLQGRPKRGEISEAITLDLRSGDVLWRSNGYSWLDRVTRSVMHGDQIAYETSSLTDSDAGNAIYILSADDGAYVWEKAYPPGMNHRRQARAMFLEDSLWILHGGRLNHDDKEKRGRAPIEISSLDPATGETKVTHPAGMTHCFPPVATPEFMIAGVLDMTDLRTGDIVANRITKANCSTENGWVPANGLIYTTPKHCTCWPMLRGFVAMAARSERDPATHRDVEAIEFPLRKGMVPAPTGKDATGPAASDWPTYRGDRWRSASTSSAGPQSLDVLWTSHVASEHEAATLKSAQDGPILHDWRENPFIKGPVSAPVVANGQVLVARTEAHEVVAMDAASGKVNWRFTANGRIDTPPTIHRGICLFGTHAGWVYALRSDTGKEIWRLRAVPDEERIVAYGQVESAWPVAGAVLVMDDIAYFAAGRQPLADGGIFIFAIDPISGERHWVHRIDDIPQSNDAPSTDPFKGFYENSGLEFDPIDILHAEGDGLAMSRWLLGLDGKTVSVDKWNAFSRLEVGDDSKGGVWIPRGSWTYSARHQHRFKGEAPRRPLVAFRADQVVSSLNGSTDLFVRDFDLDQGEEFDSKWITGWQAGKEARNNGKPYRTYRIAKKAKWTADPYASPEKKAEQEKQPAGVQVYNDIHALALSGDGRFFAVHEDGRLKVMSMADGSVLEETTVPPPVWDGLALAGGKLYLTTTGGDLVCLGAK